MASASATAFLASASICFTSITTCEVETFQQGLVNQLFDTSLLKFRKMQKVKYLRNFFSEDFYKISIAFLAAFLAYKNFAVSMNITCEGKRWR
jgi:hypothetical protein